MLKIQSDRVLIDGHEPTKEQCETMTLLANALAESDNFETVEYRDGYAEFEKVGKADELKFAPGGGKNLSINFDEGIEKVVYLYNYLELTDNATLPGNAIFYEYTVSDSSQQVAINDGVADHTTCGIAIYFKNGYALNTLNAEYLGPYTGIKKNDGTALDAPVYGFTNSVNNSLTAITITSKLAISRKSIDLTTLPGWSSLSDGSHSITIVAKAENYRDSEPSAAVSVTKGAAMPVKGDIITLDSKQYRVLKTEGTVAEVLATYAAIKQPFGTTKTYANSDVDTYCNTTFYNTLSADMQNAIVTKTFIQDKWYAGGVVGGDLDEGSGSGDPKYNGTYDWYDGDNWYTKSYIVSLSNAQYGEAILRKIYLLSVQDIIDYLNVTSNMTASNTTLTGNNLYNLFGMTSEDILLSSAPANSYYENGQIVAGIALGGQCFIDRTGVANNRTIYPAFQIDLSKISWSK